MAISSKSFLSTPVLLIVIAALTVVSANLLFTFSMCPKARQVEVVTPAEAIPFHQSHARSNHRIVEEGHRVFAQPAGFLGIEIATVDARNVHKYGVRDVVPGVLVVRPLADFNAYASGFNTRDIITHVNGQRITHSAQLRSRIAHTRPGTRIAVNVLRNGNEVVLYPTVGAKPRALQQMEEQAYQDCIRKQQNR